MHGSQGIDDSSIAASHSAARQSPESSDHMSIDAVSITHNDGFREQIASPSTTEISDEGVQNGPPEDLVDLGSI